MTKTLRETQLEQIIRDTIWMARRYADGRSTYAPDTFNRAVDLALELGITLKPDSGDKIYADDGMGGKWSREFKGFVK